MDKIAIQVPSKYLSEAVQRCLFDKGYRWGSNKDAKVRLTDEKILYVEGMTIWYDVFAADTYTPMTVDEFFEREVEKEVGVEIDSYGNTVEMSTRAIAIKGKDGYIISIIPWELYDKIGTLRPKEDK